MALCLSDKINKFSLIKPTYCDAPFINKDYLPSLIPKPGYYMGYGYKIPMLVRPAQGTIDISDNFGGALWEHAGVEQDGICYACLALFDGYDHNAYVHDSFSVVDYETGDAPMANNKALAIFEFQSNSTAVSANNVLSGYKVGVGFEDLANENYILLTSSDALSEDTSYIDIEIPASYISAVGSYKFVPYAVKDDKYYSLSIDKDKSIEKELGDGGLLTITNMTWRQEIAYIYVYVTIANASLRTETIFNQTVSYSVYNTQNYVLKSGSVSISDTTIEGKNVGDVASPTVTVGIYPGIDLTGLEGIDHMTLTYNGSYYYGDFHIGKTITIIPHNVII